MGLHCLEDTSKVREIFAGWEDTCVWSCQQKVMGTILVTDTEAPKSAIAVVGCFALVGRDPVEHAKRAKQRTTRYAGARRKLYKKITFPL